MASSTTSKKTPQIPPVSSTRRTHFGEYKAAKTQAELDAIKQAFLIAEKILLSSDAYLQDKRRVIHPEFQRSDGDLPR